MNITTIGERALDWITRWPAGPVQRMYDVDEDALMYDDCPPRYEGGTDEDGVSHTHGYDADLGRELDEPTREEMIAAVEAYEAERAATTPAGLWPTVDFDDKTDAFLREEITPEEWGEAHKAWLEAARSSAPAVPEARAEMLDDVKKLITGDRNKHYGNPTQNFTNTAALWNVQFGHKFRSGEEFTAADVAQAMIQLKMARMVASSKPDHWTDVAGYAACGYECDVDR